MGNPDGGASKTVQMTEEAYHRARVAAVLSQQTLGQWLEEAVAERFEREAAPVLLGSAGQTYPGGRGTPATRSS